MGGKFVALGNDDLAGQDDQHAGPDLAGCRQAFACAVGPRLAEPAQPIDLRRLQHREHLVMSSLDDRTFRGSHGRTPRETEWSGAMDKPVYRAFDTLASEAIQGCRPSVTAPSTSHFDREKR